MKRVINLFGSVVSSSLRFLTSYAKLVVSVVIAIVVIVTVYVMLQQGIFDDGDEIVELPFVMEE